MDNAKRSRREIYQAGAGLVELMISMVIGLLIVTSVLALTVASTSAYRIQNNHLRNQENGRIAMTFLARDARMAGHLGCLGSSTLLASNLAATTPGNLYDVRFPIEGLEQGMSVWSPSGRDASSLNVLPNTDAVTFRYAHPTEFSYLDRPATPRGEIDAAPIGGRDTFGSGNVLLISDCDKADVFQVTGRPGRENILGHETGLGTPGNRRATLGGTHGAVYTTGNSTIRRIVSVRYYVRHRGPGDPDSGVALYRNIIGIRGTSVRQEIVEGIENMQVLYGEDTSGDGLVNMHVEADEVGNWRNIRSVRIALLIRSAAEYGTRAEHAASPASFDLLGHTFEVSPESRFQRDVFTSTIALRNAL